jgi:hypothetical protein
MEPTRRTFPATQPRTFRVRPWLVAFVALCTELVVIAAVGNQGVAGALRDTVSTPGRAYADYTRGAVDAATTFAWRFAPQSGQPTHVWAAQFAGIGTLLLLTLLVVAIVARGPGGFWRVLVAVWAVVAALTPIAIMVRNVVVVPNAPGPMQSRVGQAVYGYGTFGPVIVAGLALGLVTGLIAAIVARASRRVVPLAMPSRDEESGEYLDSAFPQQYPEPLPSPGYFDEPTEQFGYEQPAHQRRGYDPYDRPTEQLSGYQQPNEQFRSYDQPTEQFRSSDQPAEHAGGRNVVRYDEDLHEHVRGGQAYASGPSAPTPYATHERQGAENTLEDTQHTEQLPEPQADAPTADEQAGAPETDPQAAAQLPVHDGEPLEEQPHQR